MQITKQTEEVQSAISAPSASDVAVQPVAASNVSPGKTAKRRKQKDSLKNDLASLKPSYRPLFIFLTVGFALLILSLSIRWCQVYLSHLPLPIYLFGCVVVGALAGKSGRAAALILLRYLEKYESRKRKPALLSVVSGSAKAQEDKP